MPGKIKVKVIAGRNLPVMDRASDTTDAFVEIKFGGVTHKTDVCRKSLNPHWNNTEWYRFEVDESELQDEPLQLRLMDHDTYSANDAIGKVVISLAPLLAREANNAKGTTGPTGGAVMSGWIPVFDTMHGIRGELNVIVKVELFSDFNKYKTSSCGVQFFHCSMIPPGYRATAIHGFVEELVVNDDPEYQWIDKIRTPRASNEARQVAFIKLSNQVQRLVGLKAAELGANAVVGYQQDFDLEGEAGVVARAIGTAVSITPLPTPSQPLNMPLCSQQQLKKYLDLLATDNESITDLNHYFQTHQDELQKFLNILNPQTSSLLDEPENIDDDDKSIELTRQSSIKNYSGNVSIYQDDYVAQKSMRHLSEDQTDLNRLLKGRDDDDSDSSGAIAKIKKIKTNFSRKLGSFRSRKSDKQDDQVSLKSNSSDTSRISFTDIRNEFKKLKRLTKRKVSSNKEDEGIGMASILARSVIHAHTSLACITEKDSENSPSSTMRHTSESDPKVCFSDEDKTKIVNTNNKSQNDNKRKLPEIRCTSLNNIVTGNIDPFMSHRKLFESCPATPIADRNEDLLKLPRDYEYYGSISSALSGDSSIYSSSEEDDESSDVKTDTEKSYETTSSVVQSILNHAVDPSFIAQIERKLSVLESASPEPNETKEKNVFEKAIEREICGNNESKSSESILISEMEGDKNITTEKETEMGKSENSISKNAVTLVSSKSHNHHFKLHNPFIHKKSQSISAPSSPTEKKSFVYRSSSRIKRQISKLSKSNMMKSISHYSLIPKKMHILPKTALSQPNSDSDVTSKAPSRETVLGSPFLSYTDLLSLDKDSQVLDASKRLHKSDDLVCPKVSMYIGSEPVSRASLSGPSSPNHGKEEFHNDHKSYRREKPIIKPTGLLHTAMETILMDKVHSLLIPTSPEPQNKEKQFFNDVNENLEKVEEKGSRAPEIPNNREMKNRLTKSTSETSLLEKVRNIFPINIDKPTKAEERRGSDNVSDREKSKHHGLRSNKHSDHSLIHTAMETILLDKVQTLLTPTSPDSASTKEKQFFKDVKDKLEEVEKARDKIPELTVEAVNFKENNNDMISKDKKKLIRQQSIHSLTEELPNPFIESDFNTVIPCKITPDTPVLQHFHPIVISGVHKPPKLETIPSLPESVEYSQSLDKEGVTETFDTHCECLECASNSVSVCDNSHAACDVNRSERDRDKREKESEKEKGSPRHARHESYGGREPAANVPHPQNMPQNTATTPVGIHRRSSDSDLSITPKGGSLNASIGNTGSGGGAILRPSMNSNNIDMLEYPFLTMTEYPSGFIVHIGGTVCARSVKLTEGGGAGGEGGARAAWWAELRTELRAHARALRCNAVLAYRDSAAICEDVCVLSASGTAAVINLDCDFNADLEPSLSNCTQKSAIEEVEVDCCSVAHVPYSPGSGPYRAELSTCGICRRARVPAVLLATCAKPNRLASHAKAVTVTALAARVRRAAPTAEPGARDISDQLPFLEYELHKLLLAKLRMQGANALFSLQTRVAVGERCVMALASGAAHRLAALPPPAPPAIKASENDKDALEIQKALWDTFNANKSANGYDIGVSEHSTNGVLPEVEGEEAPVLDLCADKDACVLELDEAEDVETAKVLAARHIHTRVFTNDLRAARGAPPHAFVQVWRARLSSAFGGVAAGAGGPGAGAGAGGGAGGVSVAGGAAGGGQSAGLSAAGERHVARALDGLAYKLRRLRPSAVAAPALALDLPDDEIQLVISGTAIRLQDGNKPEQNGVEGHNGLGHRGHATGDEDEIFALDEEQLVKQHVEPQADDKAPNGNANSPAAGTVPVTSLCAVGGAGARRVCALRLLFVRETTAVRELGGLSGFLHTFTCEVLAIVRAYTTALGGNALTSFYITQLMLQDNAHKNQGQCLLSVGGDVVYIPN